MRHLTDEEIQVHLDGAIRGFDPDLKAHLKRCSRCQNALGAYRKLYAELADDTVFKIPSDLANTVISRLGLEFSPRRLSLPADILLVAGAITVVVAVALRYLDLRPFLDTLLRIRIPLLEYVSPSLESARGYIASLNHTLTIVLAGIAVLVFMASLDTFLPRKWLLFTRRPRH